MMDFAVAAGVQNCDEADGPWALPRGWCWTRTDAVAAVNPSTNFDTLDPASEISFIPMAAVAEETGKIDFSARRPLHEVAKGYVRFREGDVIFAKITPCMENGKVAPIVGLPGEHAAGSTEFHVLRPFATDQRYLWYWLVGRGFRGRAKRNMSGSAGQLRVPVDWLRDADFPLAPLAEQRRIVARIDALFAEIAEGEAALAAARKGLDTFRRALLKAAVAGELTKEWRQEQAKSGVDAETGHDLLVRVVENRATKAPAKGRGRRNADKPPLNAAAPPALPPGWAWATLGELFDVSTGSTPSRSDPTLWNGGVPWVSSGEVAFCRIRSTKETISMAGLGNPATRLNPAGTVLLAMIGEGKTRGQCAILDVPAANNQNAAAIRVSASPIPPEFVYQVLEERYFRSRRESQGGNQLALNGGKVAEMAIPLPPLNEIVEILRLVSEARSTAADTLSMLDAEAADAERLKQSILKAAFEGRLVSQDPADEPASALLDRLAAYRATTNVKRGPAKRVS
jgi:type I restriction enzyme, S subunit